MGKVQKDWESSSDKPARASRPLLGKDTAHREASSLRESPGGSLRRCITLSRAKMPQHQAAGSQPKHLKPLWGPRPLLGTLGPLHPSSPWTSGGADFPSTQQGTRLSSALSGEALPACFWQRASKPCSSLLGAPHSAMFLFSDCPSAFINNSWEILSRSQCCLPFRSGNRQGVQQSQYPPVPRGSLG